MPQTYLPQQSMLTLYSTSFFVGKKTISIWTNSLISILRGEHSYYQWTSLMCQ